MCSGGFELVDETGELGEDVGDLGLAGVIFEALLDEGVEVEAMEEEGGGEVLGVKVAEALMPVGREGVERRDGVGGVEAAQGGEGAEAVFDPLG